MENNVLDKSKTYCIRCESLERSQQSKKIYKVKNHFGDEIPVCAICLEEIAEEEEFFKEQNEPGSEEFDQ